MLLDASRSYAKPALVAALLTAICTQIAFMSDLYFGSLYLPDIGKLLPSIMLSPIVCIPGLLFGLFFVWPVALYMAHLADWLAIRHMPKPDWPIWLGLGAVSGPIALFVYSFFLGLGQILWLALIANGVLCGITCAAILRSLAKPGVDGSATGIKEEPTDNLA